MPQILALISAVLFGVSDFTGGIATRRVSAWVVAAWSQLLGLPILVLGLVVVTSTEVTRHDLMWGAIGGVFGVVGLAIMYSTLAAGKMSVVAPVIGAGAAGIPVMWAVATGETITWINWIGICVAGLAVFNDCRPDIVIVELLMRPMDGLKVISALRANARQVPIIAISSQEHPDYPQTFAQAEAFGGVETLQNPFSNEQFIVAVSRALASAHQLASR